MAGDTSAYREVVTHMKEHVPVMTKPAATLVSTAEAASRLGLAEITLRLWRWRDNPHQPPYIKTGSRAVRYDVAALDAWRASRTHKPGTKPVKKDRSPRRQQRRRGPQ